MLARHASRTGSAPQAEAVPAAADVTDRTAEVVDWAATRERRREAGRREICMMNRGP